MPARPGGGGSAAAARFAVSYSTPLHGTDPDRLIGYAQHAEACGFEGLYVPEHVVLYPGATVGAVEMPPSLPYADPLDLLTVGLGGLPGEATAVGVDFRSRGRRADEAIDVLRLLWGGDADGVSFHGEFFDFERVCSFPKPHGATALPIHVGGSSRAAARRVGLRGDGYFPGGLLTPDERAAQWKLARSVATGAGRDPDALEYTRWGSTELSAQRVESYAAQGVTRIVVGSGADTLAEQRDDLSGFADRFGLRPPMG
ncbi:LLM class flavin-dependent oxidoreductase [Micromonospora sp. LOL_014]|uniref:LLM class flavin-dependent oxidoreductase n=1 Tax=Micromonospora sp. LOL_014 TaxID=3345415 RepID=UPI003A8803D6